MTRTSEYEEVDFGLYRTCGIERIRILEVEMYLVLMTHVININERWDFAILTIFREALLRIDRGRYKILLSTLRRISQQDNAT